MTAQTPPAPAAWPVAAGDGQPLWFLNTLTFTKVGSGQCGGQLSILDHRVPPGFAPPPHIHQETDEALLVLDGQLEGFCGDHSWRAGPGCLAFMPCAIPRGFAVSDAGPGRIIIVATPAASASSSRPPASRPRTCACPYPSRPPHPAGRRPRHPAPAPVRTATTPGACLQHFGLRIIEDHRRKRRKARGTPNAPRRLAGAPRNPVMHSSRRKHQYRPIGAYRRRCARLRIPG